MVGPVLNIVLTGISNRFVAASFAIVAFLKFSNEAALLLVLTVSADNIQFSFVFRLEIIFYILYLRSALYFRVDFIIFALFMVRTEPLFQPSFEVLLKSITGFSLFRFI